MDILNDIKMLSLVTLSSISQTLLHPPVSGLAPDLNTAVCKTSLMLQRPNLSTGAYPICRKVWVMGEVTGVRLYGSCRLITHNPLFFLIICIISCVKQNTKYVSQRERQELQNKTNDKNSV